MKARSSCYDAQVGIPLHIMWDKLMTPLLIIQQFCSLLSNFWSPVRVARCLTSKSTWRTLGREELLKSDSLRYPYSLSTRNLRMLVRCSIPRAPMSLFSTARSSSLINSLPRNLIEVASFFLLTFCSSSKAKVTLQATIFLLINLASDVSLQ